MEPAWVALSVPSFVMREDDLESVRLEKGCVLEDSRPEYRMRPHDLPLFVVEGARLQEHLFRNSYFSDIVEEESEDERLSLTKRAIVMTSDYRRIILDSPGMVTGLIVLRLQR